MEIISSDFKKGYVKLKVNNEEDLWYLSHLIDPSDLVKGKTTRKIKIGDGENAKVVKKTYVLKIEGEQIEYSPENNNLRINGKIKEGPEDLPRDSYQSIKLEVGSEFSIEKPKWLSYQRQKLEESTQKKYRYLICIFDREDVIFALTKEFGYETLLKLKGEVAKKDQKIDIKKDFHKEIIKLMEDYDTRYKPENIILASPAFYKEDLMKKITNQNIKKKIVLAISSGVTHNAIDEVIRRPELDKVLRSSRTRIERLLVNELLAEINKDHLAVYGYEDVKKAVDAGAVKKILVSDKFIHKKREENDYLELDEMMKNIDQLKGEVHIISSKQESGNKLDGIGGIAAILRYKLEW